MQGGEEFCCDANACGKRTKRCKGGYLFNRNFHSERVSLFSAEIMVFFGLRCSSLWGLFRASREIVRGWNSVASRLRFETFIGTQPIEDVSAAVDSAL